MIHMTKLTIYSRKHIFKNLEASHYPGTFPTIKFPYDNNYVIE